MFTSCTLLRLELDRGFAEIPTEGNFEEACLWGGDVIVKILGMTMN